jgi:hypothetical protein
MVGDRHDDDLAGDDPIRDRVRESAKHVAVRAIANRPSTWSPQNHFDRPLDVGGESDAQTLPLLLVPDRSLPQICARCALETVGLATLRHGGLAARLRSP